MSALGQPFSNKQTTIEWSTHFGPNGPLFKSGYYDPSGTAQKLQSLDAAGSSVGDLVADTVGSTRVGDLVELGFFDLDTNTGDTVYTPNATDDLFKGIWTPITGLTTIGQQNSGTAVGAGYFGFETVFSDHDTYLAGHDNVANTNSFTSGANYIIDDDTPTNLRYMVEGLNGVSNANIGIRFYDVNVGSSTGLDADGKTSGSTRYNTIMNTGWDWVGKGNDMVIGLYDNSNAAVLQTGLEFEFDNTTYGDNGSYTALIGTGGTNSVSDAAANSTDTDDFVATVTYYDGSSGLTLSNSGIGDTILSGLSGNGDLNGANDGNQLTLHSNTGRDDDFSGNIYTDGSTSTDLTIFKTGSGGQTFSGNINTSDSDDTADSAYLNVAEGSLTLKPGSGKTQKFEYLTGAATGGTLTLNNADESTQTIELGFANTVDKKTYSGTLTLSGSGTNTINIGGSAGTFASADGHQELSGAISGSAGLKKTGSGKLTLTGNSGSFGGGVTIADGGGAQDGGIVVANHANALGSGTTTVEHGKLAVAGGFTVTNTIQGQGTNNTAQKSVVGGGSGTSVGTITNGGAVLNIGSGNGEIDVVSPGIALATSMSNGTSDNQAIAGDHNDAGVDTLAQSIGIVKINSVGLKSGGVYDWEIVNFDGSTPGTDWDVLQFDTLAFDGSGNFDINVLSLTSNDGAGSGAGSVAGTLTEKLGANVGFKFLDGSGSNGTGITWGSVTVSGSAPNASGTIDAGYFNLNQDVFSFNNSNYYGDWSVYLDYANNDFYMQYSVVPEPSTYVMVAGLLMLPGMSYIRRFRKSGSEEESST